MDSYQAALARMTVGLAALHFHRAVERSCRTSAELHFLGAEERRCEVHVVSVQVPSIARAANNWSRPVLIESGGWTARRTMLLRQSQSRKRAIAMLTPPPYGFDDP